MAAAHMVRACEGTSSHTRAPEQLALKADAGLEKLVAHGPVMKGGWRQENSRGGVSPGAQEEAGQGCISLGHPNLCLSF